MMKWTRNMLLMPVLMVQAFSSCSLIDEPIYDDADSSVKASLAFTVSSAAGATTRMADVVVQKSNNFRGIQDVKIVPFAVDNADNGVQSTDMPKRFWIEEVSTDTYSKNNSQLDYYSQFFYYDKCFFMRGTNAALFYGRAIPQNDPNNSSSSVANKAYNGSVQASYPADMAPANIAFSLEQMYSGTETPTDAQTIATYLTSIARATGWSTTTDSKLRALYLNFTGQGNQENAILAGSSTSLTAYTNELKTTLESWSDVDATIKSAILTAIGTPSLGTYPASIGLPDGAAALRWESETMVDNAKGGFVPQIVTTTDAPVNSIARFTFPAELYYFANSQLYTSNVEVANTVYNSATSTSTQTAWEKVLESYPGRTPVSGNTQAAALKLPIQYAVARLQMTLEEPTNITLKDANNETITYKDGSSIKLPLTGIIIGGQHTLGYNFKPTGTYNPADPGSADLDLRFVYDSNVSGLESNTLVFQSYDQEKVTVILEFENKTGKSFVGKDGVIYPGTKFYLIAQKLDPSDKSTDAAIKDRVFTQDCTTEVKMKFNANSLKSAYNVLPDLLSPRLEVGVQLVDKWIQTDPSTIQLD